MEFHDQKLVCRDCGTSFVWTAGEQEFYQKKGFDNPPSRCPECRRKKKENQTQNTARGSYPITCSRCGKQDTVPFEPREGREVLCRDCFTQAKRPQ